MKLWAALLVAAALATTAQASGMLEDTTRTRLASRHACEAELKRQYEAEKAEIGRSPPDQQAWHQLTPLARDEHGRLGYRRDLDMTINAPGIIQPRSQTNEYSCRGKILIDRSTLNVGNYYFPPPPPPASN